MQTKACYLHFTLRNFIFTFAFWLLTSQFLYPQSEILKYARQAVDTLASPSMYGRGYVNKGDSIAADYIKNEFEKYKLKPLGVNFYQSFFFPVNTFPESFGLNFKETDESFKSGSQVIIGPNSPATGSSNCKVVWFDSLVVSSKKNLKRFEKNSFSDKVIIVDGKGISEPSQLELIRKAKQNPCNSKAIVVFNNKKLTWDVSQTTASFPTFEILAPDSVNKTLHKQLKYLHFYVKNKFIPSYKSQNIIGYTQGTQYPDSFIVFSAHYDHLGMMGEDIYFPGANDNASGCAMLLNLARYYSQHAPKYSIAFMAFGGEEVGLLGSKYYTENPLFPMKQIKFLVNMDIMGTGDEGIKVVNATEHKKEFEELVNINTGRKLLASIQPRGKAAISDHYFFEEAGVKTFFIYTLGGIKAYHDVYDRSETLPLTKFEEVFNLLSAFSDYLQK